MLESGLSTTTADVATPTVADADCMIAHASSTPCRPITAG
jgi:hypothetical protein